MTQQFTATLKESGPPGPPGPAISQQLDVTASRNANTVYQNAGALPLYISTTWTVNRNDTLVAMSDGNNPPTAPISRIDDPSIGTLTLQLFFIVLPGNFYSCSITAGVPSLVSWIEYR